MFKVLQNAGLLRWKPVVLVMALLENILNQTTLKKKKKKIKNLLNELN